MRSTSSRPLARHGRGADACSASATSPATSTLAATRGFSPAGEQATSDFRTVLKLFTGRSRIPKPAFGKHHPAYGDCAPAARAGDRLGTQSYPQGDDEPAPLLADLGSQPPAGVGETFTDPGGVLARRKPRVTELELERYRLEPHGPLVVELDEEEQAEVVA